MDMNTLLTVLLYVAGIVLLVVFTIVGIKLITILDKVNRIVDDVEEKVSSFDGAITTMSKVANGFANISNSLVFGVSSVVSKLFNKKIDEEDK